MRCASAAKRSVAAIAQRIGQRAQIDGEHHAAGNDVDRAGRCLDPADGADHAVLGMLARDLFQRQRHLGGAGERIVPQIHRHGAGVAGLAGHRDAQPALADDAGDDAERLALRLQHRPLLDVHLDVARGILRPVGGGGNVVRDSCRRRAAQRRA